MQVKLSWIFQTSPSVGWLSLSDLSQHHQEWKNCLATPCQIPDPHNLRAIKCYFKPPRLGGLSHTKSNGTGTQVPSNSSVCHTYGASLSSLFKVVSRAPTITSAFQTVGCLEGQRGRTKGMTQLSVKEVPGRCFGTWCHIDWCSVMWSYLVVREGRGHHLYSKWLCAKLKIRSSIT